MPFQRLQRRDQRRGKRRSSSWMMPICHGRALALVDRREGMDGDQPRLAAGAPAARRRRARSRRGRAAMSQRDARSRAAPSDRPALPGMTVVSLTGGMRSGASSGRLQSMTSREMQDSTSVASSASAMRGATGSAPGSQAIWRDRSTAAGRAFRIAPAGSWRRGRRSSTNGLRPLAVRRSGPDSDGCSAGVAALSPFVRCPRRALYRMLRILYHCARCG